MYYLVPFRFIFFWHGSVVQVSPHTFPLYVGSLAYDAYVLISCFPPHHGMNRVVQSSLVCALGFSRVMRGYICILYEDPPEVVKSHRDSSPMWWVISFVSCAPPVQPGCCECLRVLALLPRVV